MVNLSYLAVSLAGLSTAGTIADHIWHRLRIKEEVAKAVVEKEKDIAEKALAKKAITEDAVATVIRSIYPRWDRVRRVVVHGPGDEVSR